MLRPAVLAPQQPVGGDLEPRGKRAPQAPLPAPLVPKPVWSSSCSPKSLPSPLKPPPMTNLWLLMTHQVRLPI